MKTKMILTFVCLFAAIMLPSLLHAQPGFGDDVGDAPIDGGLSLLIAAGVGYGAKKIHQTKKRSV